jgi:hypothetical protein
MKKLILTAAMIIGLLTANANDHMYKFNAIATDLTVKSMEGLKFKVTALNMSQKSVLEIKDAQGQVIYKTVIVDPNYTKVFNLASLPDGTYTWTLNTGKESTIKPFEIKTETTRMVISN